jgi:hypothetical protein
VVAINSEQLCVQIECYQFRGKSTFEDIFLLFMQFDAKINDTGASTTFCVDRFPDVDILGSHHFGSQILAAFFGSRDKLGKSGWLTSG